MNFGFSREFRIEGFVLPTEAVEIYSELVGKRKLIPKFTENYQSNASMRGISPPDVVITSFSSTLQRRISGVS